MARPKDTRAPAARNVRKRAKRSTERPTRPRSASPEKDTLSDAALRAVEDVAEFVQVVAAATLQSRDFDEHDVCEELRTLRAFALIGDAYRATRELAAVEAGPRRDAVVARIDRVFGAPATGAAAKAGVIVAARELLHLVAFALESGDATTWASLQRAAEVVRTDLPQPEQRALVRNLVHDVVANLRAGRPTLEERTKAAEDMASRRAGTGLPAPKVLTLMEAAIDSLLDALATEVPSPAAELFQDHLEESFVRGLLERALSPNRGDRIEASYIAAALSLEAGALGACALPKEKPSATLVRLTRAFNIAHARTRMHGRGARPAS